MASVQSVDIDLTVQVSGSRKFWEKSFKFICMMGIIIACAFLAFLLYSIFKDGWARVNSELFQNFPSRRPAKAGMKAGIFGSLWVIGVTAGVAVPVGVAAAVYLEMFTSKRNKLSQFIQLNIANLAGVPSIVYGLLGLALFVRTFEMGRSVLAGGLTMALLILPVIIVVSQEAIRAVPKAIYEGSLALGATRWQTVAKQVLPNAMPGIITGIILSISRAIGETAPLIAIGAVTFIAKTPESLDSMFTVMPVQIYEWSSRPQEEFHEVAAAGIIVLLGTLILLNSVAIIIRARSQSKH
jgi:phosphate transport system permease protein